MKKTLLSISFVSLFCALAGSALALEQRPVLSLEVAKKTVGLLAPDLRATGGMNENYNPDTGKPAAADHFVPTQPPVRSAP